MRAFWITIVATLLSGCVGYQRPAEQQWSVPASRAWLSSTRVGFVNTVAPPVPYTRELVRKEWGTPDRTETSAGVERWFYNRELRWSGAIVLVIVPIPLVVPTGHYQTALDFSDEQLIYVHSGLRIWYGSVCGVVNGGHDIAVGCFKTPPPHTPADDPRATRSTDG